MANVLFLGMPTHGHVNPTLGLVHELTLRGEKVSYFASETFRTKIEAAGAVFYQYSEDLDIFKAAGKPGQGGGLLSVINKAPSVIADVLKQTEGIKFDYLIHSAAFPFTGALVQILGIPSVSSLAVFAGLDKFKQMANFTLPDNVREDYARVATELQRAYGITLPGSPLDLMLYPSPLKLVYTSRYFAPPSDYLDDTCRFVGPPVYERHEDMDFPFERLKNKRVLYISLGTVFGGFDTRVYHIFKEAFADWDGVVVMTAHGVDLSNNQLPTNFIVRDYVPQNALLKYTDVAITHAGMNSMSDLISNEVPFVSLPMGADQPLLAARAAELGATIVLDITQLKADELRDAVNTVITEPGYLRAIEKISDSFRAAGGYSQAVNEIFRLIYHQMEV
ncbi:macrolide family glycosyltransferase [Mucilaginibacter sp. X4EP1]|uniref:macrolide family glycosyltransferase n=1 Tax=Mucilaginibacter sp. X4EP1 TaxID=2723092 RepID=UPI0021693066|nr:macrolide family glycosyltransferase [Mucilaginibacter sp. X4EP1]MCS3815965.1 MGT family glycosyltransferase [Mucilaginibacter sp. X4EP1]